MNILWLGIPLLPIHFSMWTHNLPVDQASQTHNVMWRHALYCNFPPIAGKGVGTVSAWRTQPVGRQFDMAAAEHSALSFWIYNGTYNQKKKYKPNFGCQI